MAKPISSPYHLAPQSAVALLGPIEASLAELEARLTQFIERIPMSDADRETVARARGIVAEDRAKIAALVASPSRETTEG
jgi:hypothetical protein